MCVIGVLTGSQGEIADLLHAVSMKLYERKDNWSLKKQYCLNKIQTMCRSEVQTFTEDLISIFLQSDCKCLVGVEIVGIAYQLLDRNKILICETEEKMECIEQMMEEIYLDFFIKKPEEKIQKVLPHPVELEENGVYFFDFDLAIQAHPSLSSKKMLLPFLKEKCYTCLVIRCSHIMPWLASFAENNNLLVDQKMEEGVYMIHITQGSILVTTSAGVLKARFSELDHRSRDRESIIYYPDGEVRSVYLEGVQMIQTPIGEKPAELITFYKSGKVKRVFPSYGKISGFWSEEEEKDRFPIGTIRVLNTEITARISCYNFYEDGAIKSITLYPGETVEFIWKKKLWKARYGMSFYPGGELAAFEPATTTKVELLNGVFEAYDSMAVGITGDRGSLIFYQDGRIKALKSCTSALCQIGKTKVVVKPEKIPSPMDIEVSIVMPVLYQFGDTFIRGTDSHGKEFHLDCTKHLDWGVL